ncbi:MAG: hypothetical protein ACI4QT_01820 [Kiritimatiellia bacterium]
MNTKILNLVLFAALSAGMAIPSAAQATAEENTQPAKSTSAESDKIAKYVELARLVLSAESEEQGVKIIHTILDRISQRSKTEEARRANIQEMTVVITAALTVSEKPYSEALYQELIKAASKLTQSAAEGLSLARAAAATGSAVTDSASYVATPAGKVDALLREEVVEAGANPGKVLAMTEAHSLRELYKDIVRRLKLSDYEIKLDLGEAVMTATTILSGNEFQVSRPSVSGSTTLPSEIHEPVIPPVTPPVTPDRPSPTPTGLR